MNGPGKGGIELWGGAECTVHRLADRYFDQVERTGFAGRLGDLDRFASLGIRTLRMPVLWERTAPAGIETADWSWPDSRLARLAGLGITPIVGLMHHGSGPPSTSLIDPHLGEALARYAGAVAQRYPHVDLYTPINEPLTTARFSTLYGYWYPHATDPHLFARAVLNQCRATILAMRAVRAVNPGARLVQTEDLGRTHSTPLLQYQAAFENDRRWLTFDLLTGRLGPGDRMWRYFRDLLIPEAELAWFQENACPPDILGVNYYLTSERFLDPRLWRYPQSAWGGNGRHRYADVEASRVLGAGAAGPAVLIREAWERYRLPIAVTEVHNGCTREEQLRWLLELWNAAQEVRRSGVDVRAVTMWALLGSVDWSSLLTNDRGEYEPGAFDVRSAEPRETALATLARELATGRSPSSPLATQPGWWHREVRFEYGAPAAVLDARPDVIVTLDGSRVPPILVTGATGTLGRAFALICATRGLDVVVLGRADADLTDGRSLAAVMETHRPWAVVNAAGYVRVDDAESDAETCMRVNAHGAALLAEAAAAAGAGYATFSSDLVFDGGKAAPYVESDQPAPLNVYGRSKALAEQQVLAAHPQALVVRTSAFFGPWDDYNFVTHGLRELAEGRDWLAGPGAVSPTYVPDLVNTVLDLLIDGEAGVWHLANAGQTTWHEIARRAAEAVGFSPDRVREVTAEQIGWRAIRPPFSALGSERAMLLPRWESALDRYVAAVARSRTSSAALRPAMNA